MKGAWVRILWDWGLVGGDFWRREVESHTFADAQASRCYACIRGLAASIFGTLFGQVVMTGLAEISRTGRV